MNFLRLGDAEIERSLIGSERIIECACLPLQPAEIEPALRQVRIDREDLSIGVDRLRDSPGGALCPSPLTRCKATGRPTAVGASLRQAATAKTIVKTTRTPLGTTNARSSRQAFVIPSHSRWRHAWRASDFRIGCTRIASRAAYRSAARQSFLGNSDLADDAETAGSGFALRLGRPTSPDFE